MRSSPGLSTRGLATRGRMPAARTRSSDGLQPVEIQIIERDAGGAEFDGGVQLRGRAHQQMKGCARCGAGGRNGGPHVCRYIGPVHPVRRRGRACPARRPRTGLLVLQPLHRLPPHLVQHAMPAQTARPPSPARLLPVRMACSPAAPVARAASPHRARGAAPGLAAPASRPPPALCPRSTPCPAAAPRARGTRTRSGCLRSGEVASR